MVRPGHAVWRGLLVALLLACSRPAGADEWVWNLPAWMEPPPVPADNPMTVEKVALGRRLFYELNLSGPGYMACATCHDPHLAFSDHRRTAIGITGQFHPRNSMALANVGYFATLTWADPNLTRLEDQALVPLLGEHPVEMAVTGSEERVLSYLRHDPIYPGMFLAAFPEDDGRIDLNNAARAIAAFERTLISGNAPFDFYREGRSDALSPAAQRGAALFFGERLQCGACHSGPHLSDMRFHNTGLHNEDGAGALPEGNQGMIEHTGLARDMGRFRTPSLRNVALTPPYMHDGSILTLEEMIAHYAAGGRAALHGAASPLTDPLVSGFVITPEETADLLAFLDSLTDPVFLADESLQSPFR
jgi:cytochrome c peroxidase